MHVAQVSSGLGSDGSLSGIVFPRFDVIAGVIVLGAGDARFRVVPAAVQPVFAFRPVALWADVGRLARAFGLVAHGATLRIHLRPSQRWSFIRSVTCRFCPSSQLDRGSGPR